MHCSKIASLFDHLVSAEQGHQHVRADRRRGLEIDFTSSELVGGLCIRWAAQVDPPRRLI